MGGNCLERSMLKTSSTLGKENLSWRLHFSELLWPSPAMLLAFREIGS